MKWFVIDMDYGTFAASFQEAEYDHGADLGVPHWLDGILDHPQAVEKPRKPAAPRQNGETRLALIHKAEAGIAELTAAKLRASATAREKIDDAARVHAADTAAKDRARVSNMCLGQRNALVRVLCALEGVEQIVILTDRAKACLDDILALSANVAALTKSDWISARSWLAWHFPVIVTDHEGWLQAGFERHYARAKTVLSRTVAIKWRDYRTAPLPADIAERHGITTDILRAAKANKVGLTSIDPESKLDRDRRNAEARRRKNGSKPQSSCTKTADDKRLAVELDCGASTLRRHRKAGTLDAYVAQRREQLSSRG